MYFYILLAVCVGAIRSSSAYRVLYSLERFSQRFGVDDKLADEEQQALAPAHTAGRMFRCSSDEKPSYSSIYILLQNTS